MLILICSLLVVAITAAPILDVFADPCSGNGEPVASVGSLVGKCYGGESSVLTISEHGIFQIKSYDPVSGKGTLRVDAEGFQTVHCPPATFTKLSNEREIKVDLTACGKIHKAVASAEYCSDQDTVRIHVKVPDSTAPGASNLPLIPVTLKPMTCKEAHNDLKASKSTV